MRIKNDYLNELRNRAVKDEAELIKLLAKLKGG